MVRVGSTLKIWVLFMSKQDKRSEVRHRALIPAFASDVDETFQLRCLIRDVSETGCQLVANKFYEIPEVFHLTPDGISMPVCGRVKWQDRKMIGVQLQLDQSQVTSGMSLLASEKLISSDDGVLLLGEELQRPLTYHERLKIYFAALEAAPEMA